VDLHKISQIGAEWHVEWWYGRPSKSKPEVEFQYGRRLSEFNGMSSKSHVPHCRVKEFHPPYWKSFFAIFYFIFCFPNAVCVSVSGGFRIVFDTVVIYLKDMLSHGVRHLADITLTRECRQLCVIVEVDEWRSACECNAQTGSSSSSRVHLLWI